jgi:hypothetical protein
MQTKKQDKINFQIIFIIFIRLVLLKIKVITKIGNSCILSYRIPKSLICHD